jgi:hypothetical protein
MYWLDLSDHPESSNTSTVTVELLKENYLCPEKLDEMMTTVAKDGSLYAWRL